MHDVIDLVSHTKIAEVNCASLFKHYIYQKKDVGIKQCNSCLLNISLGCFPPTVFSTSSLSKAFKMLKLTRKQLY